MKVLSNAPTTLHAPVTAGCCYSAGIPVGTVGNDHHALIKINKTTRTMGRSGVLLPGDHRAHGRFYINKTLQSTEARHLTTTACCPSPNRTFVCASVGESEVVRGTKTLENRATFCSAGRLLSRPPILCGKRRTKTCNYISL